MSIPFYKLSPEEQYRAERKAEAERKKEYIKEKNASLVGDIKEYKGYQYRMNQRGNIECINLPPLSGLEGTFTTTHTLHAIIDNIEKYGNPSK
tara:strand:- start:1064 stop:1342 length:279 start_codon:yes stop_codon:yes gene_type:complete